MLVPYICKKNCMHILLSLQQYFCGLTLKLHSICIKLIAIFACTFKRVTDGFARCSGATGSGKTFTMLGSFNESQTSFQFSFHPCITVHIHDRCHHATAQSGFGLYQVHLACLCRFNTSHAGKCFSKTCECQLLLYPSAASTPHQHASKDHPCSV